MGAIWSCLLISTFLSNREIIHYSTCTRFQRWIEEREKISDPYKPTKKYSRYAHESIKLPCTFVRNWSSWSWCWKNIFGCTSTGNFYNHVCPQASRALGGPPYLHLLHSCSNCMMKMYIMSRLYTCTVPGYPVVPSPPVLRLTSKTSCTLKICSIGSLQSFQ